MSLKLFLGSAAQHVASFFLSVDVSHKQIKLITCLNELLKIIFRSELIESN